MTTPPFDDLGRYLTTDLPYELTRDTRSLIEPVRLSWISGDFFDEIFTWISLANLGFVLFATTWVWRVAPRDGSASRAAANPV